MVINMTEKEILISYALDKKQSAYDNSMITNTRFLSMDERTEIVHLEKELASSVRTFYFGGYENAERTAAVFIPSFYETGVGLSEFFNTYKDDNPVALLRLKKDRFSSLSHRDYLGSLMGLGIKRDVLGDILPLEDGCYIFCLKSIAEYICKNLTKVGRGAVECYISEDFDLSEYKDNFDEIFLSIASLRLDNIVSGAFNLSRSDAFEAINKGIVYVNSVKVYKPDLQVSEKDKVVLRGKGKVVLDKIAGLSKKGRTHIIIKRYK